MCGGLGFAGSRLISFSLLGASVLLGSRNENVSMRSAFSSLCVLAPFSSVRTSCTKLVLRHVAALKCPLRTFSLLASSSVHTLFSHDCSFNVFYFLFFIFFSSSTVKWAYSFVGPAGPLPFSLRFAVSAFTSVTGSPSPFTLIFPLSSSLAGSVQPPGRVSVCCVNGFLGIGPL